MSYIPNHYDYPHRFPQSTQERVDYAAATIQAGRKTDRHFDGCFENHDSAEVINAIVNNPSLAKNIRKYLAQSALDNFGS